MQPLPHRARRRPRRGASGFTLIELLVTIGILIFVLGISIVGFSAMFKTVGVNAGARVLRAAVDGAKIRAIQQRRHIRFEAQLVPGSTTHEWRVAASAGDVGQEWKVMPNFVALSTNAGYSSGGDGRDGTYRGAAGESGTMVQMISVTFGPDGSVKRWRLGGTRNDTDGTYSTVASGESENPSTAFAIRLTNKRDTRGAQPPRHWLVVIPLTGGLQPYGAEGETF